VSAAACDLATARAAPRIADQPAWECEYITPMADEMTLRALLTGKSREERGSPVRFRGPAGSQGSGQRRPRLQAAFTFSL
jgi:hypothetical protein